MRIAVRADASLQIGSGHVMRCLALAQGLAERGADVIFIMRAFDGGLLQLVRENGFAVAALEGHTQLQQIDEVLDASLTKAALEARRFDPDWVIVDHYSLGEAWETAMMCDGARLLAIDDLADRPHSCTVLLDQNLVADMDIRYAGLAESASLMLLGPIYALLKPEYRLTRSIHTRETGPVQRILVYFGAADQTMTRMTVEAFASLKLAGVSMDVVLNTTNPQYSILSQMCSGTIRLHPQLPNLAAAMAKADLALGASGTTSWERLCLGLPALVITMADNQVPLARELSRRGFIVWLGSDAGMNVARIAAGLKNVVVNGFASEVMTTMMCMVDGWGAERVCDAIMPDAEHLHFRPVNADDKDLVLTWANDPGTRQHAFNAATISSTDHEKWFAKRLCNPDVVFFVAETRHDIPVGQVRFERLNAQTSEISYLLAPHFRGCGLGKPMLAGAVAQFRATNPGIEVMGQVKFTNDASLRIFRSLGFSETISPDNDILVFRLPPG